MPDDIVIRPLETLAEMHAVEDIQREAWGMIERDIVPAHILLAFVRYGEIVLGAFDGAVMAGFVLGFPGLLAAHDERAGWLGTRISHRSEMLGVRRAYQGCGIGFALKVAQREHVLAQGMRLVTWTFDPLVGRNAHLNLARLGGICRLYIPDAYGELTGINAGLATDRVEVEWWVASRHVADRLAGSAPVSRRGWEAALGAQVVNESTARPDGLRAPPEVAELPSPPPPYILVEAPGDIGAVKAADMGLARAWQAYLRALLRAAFGLKPEPYTITHFASEVEAGVRRSYYLLQRGFDVAALAREGSGADRAR